MSDMKVGPVGFKAPEIVLSIPEAIDWHVIYEHELVELSNPQSGVYGAAGFTFLGGAIGLFQGILLICTKEAKDISQSDVNGGVLGLICSALAVFCLLTWGIAKYRNAGLAQRIRNRPKHRMPTSGVLTSAPSQG